MKDSEVCRICVNVFKMNKLIEIFTEESKVLEQFEKLTGLSLPNSDNLSNKICITCKDNLSFAFQFQQTCIESQKHFNLKNEDMEMEDNFQHEDEFLDIAVTLLNLKAETKTISKIEEVQEKDKSSPVKKTKSKTKKREKQSLICELCGNCFKHRYQLTAHVQRHVGNKSFECEICGNKFFTNSELKRHMRSHTGEKPFQCKFCHRKFSDHSTIIKHERTHTNERPFNCGVCGKRFSSGFVLKNHKLIHSGLREFSCTICNRSFPLKQHLITHMKSLTHSRKALIKKDTVVC